MAHDLKEAGRRRLLEGDVRLAQRWIEPEEPGHLPMRWYRAWERTRGRKPRVAEERRALEVDGGELPAEPGEQWPHELAILARRRLERLREEMRR